MSQCDGNAALSARLLQQKVFVFGFGKRITLAEGSCTQPGIDCYLTFIPVVLKRSGYIAFKGF